MLIQLYCMVIEQKTKQKKHANFMLLSSRLYKLTNSATHEKKNLLLLTAHNENMFSEHNVDFDWSGL